MARVLREQGYKVEATDIKEGHDFLQRRARVANIVTNPPYSQSMAEAFVRHAMEIAQKKTAMLLPFYFLEGVQRFGLFTSRAWPVKAVYVFSRRPTFGEKDDHSPFGCVWVVWDRSYQHFQGGHAQERSPQFHLPLPKTLDENGTCPCSYCLVTGGRSINSSMIVAIFSGRIFFTRYECILSGESRQTLLPSSLTWRCPFERTSQ